MTETPSPSQSPTPIIEPNDGSIVKWTGMAITVLVLMLTLFVLGWFAAFLGLIASFGTLMICVGSEAEAHRQRS